MKRIDHLGVVLLVLVGIMASLGACSDDEGTAEPIGILVTASDCSLSQINFNCPDSNLFVVNFSASVSGPEGTFIGFYASGVSPQTTMIDCGDWTHKNYPGIPGCSREPGDPDGSMVSVEAELPCLEITEVYGSLNFNIAGFDPGQINVSLPFASSTADVFVNCSF